MRKKEMGINKLSARDIVIYALYILGGAHSRIHTEDIALKCYDLASSEFSLVKYPQYPDITPARFALEGAKKPESGALVRGESERKRAAGSIGGWMLTPTGIQWIKANISKIESNLGKHGPIGDRLSSSRKLKELLNSIAYKKYKEFSEQANISHADFAESLVSTVNTRADVLDERLNLIYSTAEELGIEDVKKYVRFCRIKFAALLGKQGEE